MKPYRKLAYCKAVISSALVFPAVCLASFIETTIGTAVVNDATAAYYNPAALVLLKSPQIIPLGTAARFRTQFSGQSTTVATGFMQQGSSSLTSNYYSPSLYFGLPLNDRVTLGFAAVSNFANRNPEESSILRYVQAGNSIEDYDFVPSIGVKLNESLAVGGGINFSYTSFHLNPIVGFPGTNITDSQGSNQSDGSGVGANAGFLWRPANATLIGFDYRTMTTYGEGGSSSLNSSPPITSNQYHFKLRTPARSILSANHWITPAFGIVATVQRIQWSVIRNINVYNFATLSGGIPVIVSASVPYYLRNTWLFTLGGGYKFKPDWILRVAATYNQSPSNGHYQVATGDSYVLGASLGYDINPRVKVDGSYAHVFYRNESININGTRFIINGSNAASRDVVSLKLTFNV